MTTILIAILAYFIDRFFGEFKRFRHPLAYIGDMINFYKDRYYKDSLLNGFGLVVFIVCSIAGIALVIEEFLSYFISLLTIGISALIASIFISYTMLYRSVQDVLDSANKQETLAILLDKDTKNMSESDVYKTTIETYAKNLNNGVIAPIFYLLLFGLPGILVYKAINTMDSMVGYKNQKYTLFGKPAALLDDLVNFIPARITAVLIMIFSNQKDIFSFYENGKEYESPNTGHPISAMALALDINLGKKRDKKEEITAEDVIKALHILPK